MSIETLATEANRAIDRLASHLVSEADDNDAAAHVAGWAATAKEAVRSMCPEGSVAEGQGYGGEDPDDLPDQDDEPGEDYDPMPAPDDDTPEPERDPGAPVIKPTVGPGDLPGSESDRPDEGEGTEYPGPTFPQSPVR